ncbi:MAG: cell wall-binding repeat-containing protein [Actinobacteria bacterium]|nr:cell wall-binding repeat-containing protein [Actinomycetota bacterium]
MKTPFSLLRVLETLKGTPRTEATILVPGGTVEGATMALDSEPVFRAGEMSILFLDSDGRAIGGPQGKVSVEKEMVPTLRMSAADTLDRITQAVDDESSWRSASKTLPDATAAAGSSGTIAAPFVFQAQTSAASPAERFADGFEGGMARWKLLGDPTWGPSSYTSRSGARSAYCAGSSIPAPGPYANHMNAWMIAGPFDLTDSTVAALEYDALLDTEAGYDWFFAGVSIDGVDFFGESGTGQSSFWSHRNLDLSALPDNSGGFLDYSAQPKVWVAFVFESDGMGTDRGVWVDEVRLIAEQSPVTPVPVITSIDPGRQSAGASSQVTVRGTGFGSTPGRVEFFSSPGGAKVSAPISSWSDTEIVCYVPNGQLTGFPGSASSGPVTVRNSSGQRSEGFPFSVTFAYSGSKLDVHASRDYRVNPNTPDTADEKRLVDAAVNAWGKESEFFLVDTGTCSAQIWDYNQQSELFWTTDLPGGVVAATGTYSDDSGVREFDVGFNDDYLWGDGTGGSYDVQSVAMHELGHAAGLLDLYGAEDVGKVMYGFGSAGERLRALHPDDKAGVLSLYGPPKPVKITTAVIGEGSVQRSPDQTEFYRGESVTLTAVPGPGYTFYGWIGGATGSKNPVTVPITAQTGVTAVFTGFVPKSDLRTFTGPDRYATAAMISQKAYPNKAPVVFLVKGDNFPDALAAGPLASAYGGPVMITPTEGLNQTVRQELARLRPSTVFVIGLPDALDGQVRAVLPGVTIKTIRGQDRYHTATLLADELRTKLGTVSRVVLAAGDNFPDALAVGPLAAKMGWAILLTPEMGPLPEVTAQTIQDLGVEQALRVGTRVPLPASVGVVTDKVGTDRYHTSALVAEYGMTLGLSLEHIAMVKGDNYPDALVVGPYMAQESGTLLLTAQTALSAQIGALLLGNRAAVATCDIVGLPAEIQTPIRARLPAWTGVAAGQEYSVGVKADGSLWAWGNNNGRRPNDPVPARVGIGTDWLSVSTQENHRLAIKADGSLWGWGDNSHGQLGDGTLTYREAPVRIGSATDWLTVSAGSGYTLGVRRDGTLWAWGANSSGQLGDGGLTDRHTPVRIGDAKDWVAVSVGGTHSAALKADGTLWLWGSKWGLFTEASREPKKFMKGLWTAVSVGPGGGHVLGILPSGQVHSPFSSASIWLGSSREPALSI